MCRGAGGGRAAVHACSTIQMPQALESCTHQCGTAPETVWTFRIRCVPPLPPVARRSRATAPVFNTGVHHRAGSNWTLWQLDFLRLCCRSPPTWKPLGAAWLQLVAALGRKANTGRLTFSRPRTLKEMLFSTGSKSGRYRTTSCCTSIAPCTLSGLHREGGQGRGGQQRSIAAVFCCPFPAPPPRPTCALLTCCGQPGSGRCPSTMAAASGCRVLYSIMRSTLRSRTDTQSGWQSAREVVCIEGLRADGPGCKVAAGPAATSGAPQTVCTSARHAQQGTAAGHAAPCPSKAQHSTAQRSNQHSTAQHSAQTSTARQPRPALPTCSC